MRTHGDIHPGASSRPRVATAGGVNHPCPWPLAALISGERRSRTRSISDAAGNDTSASTVGPGAKKRLRSPARPLHYRLRLHSAAAAATLLSASRTTKSQKGGGGGSGDGGEGSGGVGGISQKERDCTSPFFLGPEKQQEDEERRRGSLVAFIWNHIRWHGTAALSFQASLSLSVPHTHTHAHTLTRSTYSCMHVRHILMHSWTDRE